MLGEIESYNKFQMIDKYKVCSLITVELIWKSVTIRYLGNLQTLQIKPCASNFDMDQRRKHSEIRKYSALAVMCPHCVMPLQGLERKLWFKIFTEEKRKTSVQCSIFPP